MPICPGCERSVSYDRLDLHQRYCEGIKGAELDRARAVERLDQRLAAVEMRLDRRLRNIETDLERRLTEVEQSRRAVSQPNGRD